jgi:Leucine-rich repeat (LRR) protein
MTQDEAHGEVERKIEEARRSGAQHLDLSRAYKHSDAILDGLPRSLGQLTQLRSLNLAGNRLRTLPGWIESLNQLRTLVISDNSLETLPSSFERFTQLRSLDISWNRMTEVPAPVRAFSQLESLSLDHNKLGSVPEWLGQFSRLQSLSISSAELTILPESMRNLTQLKSLDLSRNELRSLPEWMGELVNLSKLDVASNQLEQLPSCLGLLRQLSEFHVWMNPLQDIPSELIDFPLLTHFAFNSPTLTEIPSKIFLLKHLTRLDLSGFETLNFIPDDIGKLTNLDWLHITRSKVDRVPNSVSELRNLTVLGLDGNQLTDLPSSLLALEKLSSIRLKDNPLNPELAAAYKEGIAAVKRYLRAKTGPQVSLWEAKMILVGEGEVGKSSLLGALRDEAWTEDNPTTHGIEIKPVKITSPIKGTEITFNGWDFGGQRVYRPTHQLFFSAPAVYLVVWKPREGPQQGFVKEWISLIKHRAPDAKIIVVATHGGPKQRQPDIDRQEIWDLFGKDVIVDFFLVDSKPDKKGKRKGIAELKKAIARVAATLPEMGRKVPQRWEQTRQALKKTGAAYLPLPRVESLCFDHKMDADEARDFIRISHRLGHLIHYEHDPILQNLVVLKPDWLSTAISFVLDDEQTRKDHGLVSPERLGQLWDDPKRKDRYPKELHPVFLGLMERYDLSYRIPDARKNQTNETSLIAQLVPDVRPPEHEFRAGWHPGLARGDEQQSQICRIVDAKSGQSATAEGLFYQLIVRLHKYSLGRVNRDSSLHWQRGLVLDDDYNGRALLENVGNDVRITVRAAYPERFLSVLTHEVKWLVENFWKGLRCEVTVPCMAPCGKDAPGTGLFEVEKLIAFKKQKMQKFPCYVSGCSQAQDIDSLLRNAPAARRTAVEVFLADNFDEMRSRLDAVRDQLNRQDHQARGQFDILDQNDRRILSRIEDAYTGLMQSLTDEAKEGPRLFGFEPVDRTFFSRPKWVSAKFRLTLWCEHSRLPLPVLNGKGDSRGVYELDLPRDWVVKAAPYLKLVTGLLSLVVPVAGSAMKLELDDAAYKEIEKQLEFGQKSFESALKGTEKAEDWATSGDAPDLEQGNSIRAQGAVLRQLHAWLKEKDPSFGGLVRVQNRRQEFVWVHPKFQSEY